MRKTRKCTASMLQRLTDRLLARTCHLSRSHDGKHHDDHGAWTL